MYSQLLPGLGANHSIDSTGSASAGLLGVSMSTMAHAGMTSVNASLSADIRNIQMFTIIRRVAWQDDVSDADKEKVKAKLAKDKAKASAFAAAVSKRLSR